jgi:hypothetical protein
VSVSSSLRAQPSLLRATYNHVAGLLFGVRNAWGKDSGGAEGGQSRDNGALQFVSSWPSQRLDMPYLPEKRSESHHERGAGAMDGRMGASLMLR